MTDKLPDFGQQKFGYEDPHPWALPLLGAITFGMFMWMIILGKAPWQS